MKRQQPDARPAFVAEPTSLGQAKHWLDLVEQELHKCTVDLANAALVRPDASPLELWQWRKRLNRFVLHLSRRRKYLKNRIHYFHMGVDIPVLDLSGEDAMRAHNAMQEEAAAKLRAAKQTERDEHNRQLRVLAHAEDTTNPYLLLGATKELVERLTEGDRDCLTVDERVMLANVRAVLKSPAARESIDRYVATKVVQDEHSRLV